MAAPQCGQRKDLLRWARAFLFFKMVISFFCVLLEFTQKTGGYPRRFEKKFVNFL